MIKVFIRDIGIVTAELIQRYVDGDVRVLFNGVQYIAKEVA